MLKLLIQLCVLTIGLCYATPSCHDLQKSQLASLNERITQMLSTLYAPTQSSTTPGETSSNATPSNEYTSGPYEAPYYAYQPTYAVPAPQVIYVSPSQGMSHPFTYSPPPIPNVAVPPPVPNPYHHLEMAGQPLDPYRGYPVTAPKPPISNYYDHYSYTLPHQYAAPPPVPYAPTSYPSLYQHSWEYGPPYPEYRVPPAYLPKPVYSPPLPTLPPSYPSSAGYLPPIPYPSPYYPKQPELLPPPYYA